MKRTFQLKTRKRCLVLPLIHLETGLNRVGLVLLQLHPELDSIIQKTYRLLSLGINLLIKHQKSVIVECRRRIKPTILNDKKIILNNTFLTMNWLRISVQDLIGKEEVLRPFWNERCGELSRSSWLPTGTDCVDSRSNSSSLSWKRKGLNSLFSIERVKNPEIRNSATTFCPSSVFIHTGEWPTGDIRSRKIRLYPTPEQKRLLTEWMGVTRYVYNKALSGVKRGEDKLNWMSLRNKYVTAKGNDLNDWELAVPKDVRAESIRDLAKAYKTAFANLKRGNISKFNVAYRSKRKDSSIVIPKTSVKFNSTKLTIFARYNLGPIRVGKDRSLSGLKINYDCRLGRTRGLWYLYVPQFKKTVKSKGKFDCALDPGIRKFQTLYSEKEVVKVVPNKELRQRLYSRKDLLQSLKRCNSRKRGINRINTKITNLTDDMHWKFIHYMKQRYSTVHIPVFESQKLGIKNRRRGFNRIMFDMKHYQFRTRLIDSFKLTENAGAIECTEEYTSKTCTRCGYLNNVGSSEVYDCENCWLNIDRDVNGARNIYIKHH